MIAMECKEVCILGEVRVLVLEKNDVGQQCPRMCFCFADCLYVCKHGVREKKGKVDRRVGKGSERDRKGESMNVSGKARTLAILSLGSLTAAVIAVGNLLLFQTG